MSTILLRCANALVLALAIAGPTLPASARSISQCESYARQAVNQYNLNRSIPGCFLGDDSRWHADAEQHFQWCLQSGDAAIWRETAYRARALRGCQARAGN